MSEYGIFQSIIEITQEDRDRDERRKTADSNSTGADASLRKAKSEYMARSMMKKTGRDMQSDYIAAKDAANRHLRRHPELNESTIEFI